MFFGRKTPPQPGGPPAVTVGNAALGSLGNGTMLTGASMLAGGSLAGAGGACGASSNNMPQAQIRKASPEPPEGWTTVDTEYDPMTNQQVVWESPANGQQVWIGSMTISSRVAWHHFELFARLYPKVKYLTCAIQTKTGQAVSTPNGLSTYNVMFFTREDFETFENWLAHYIKLFGDRSALYSHMLPPPPGQMGYSHQIRIADHDNLIDACLWFRENCVDDVYFLANRLFFLNDQDAILYKLKFIKPNSQ